MEKEYDMTQCFGWKEWTTGFVFVGISCAMLYLEEPMSFEWIVGLITLIFFGGALVIGFYGRRHTSFIKLDEKGLTLQRRGKSSVLAWNEIIGWGEIVEIYSVKFLPIHLRKSYDSSGQALRKSFCGKFNANLLGTPYAITLPTQNWEGICDDIVEYWERYSNRVVLRRAWDLEDEAIRSKVFDLYQHAFPAEERRGVDELERSICESEEIRFFNIFVRNQWIGFTIYWDLGAFGYLEHFAIDPQFRGAGYGQQVTELWHSFFGDKPIIMEAEPAENELTSRRIEFYKRNGFEVVSKHYLQPLYGAEGEPILLWLLASESIPADILESYAQTIKERVYYAFYCPKIKEP